MPEENQPTGEVNDRTEPASIPLPTETDEEWLLGTDTKQVEVADELVDNVEKLRIDERVE